MSIDLTNVFFFARRNPYATRVNTLQEEEDVDDDEKRSTYNGNSVNHE
jgi:hypothetical protein